MMFEYTSDYLAEKLRENWLLRCHTDELTQWNKQEQDDDSLTNLNWLQTLNIHEFTCTGQPFSPPSTPPLHHFNVTNDDQFASTSTITTKSSSPQKLHTIHNFNVSLNNYKRNNYSLFTSLRHRNENTTYPTVNNTKHLAYYTTNNDNHSSISSSVGNTSKQYKELPLRCLNNTINFHSNYNSIHHQHTPVYTTINTTMNSNILQSSNNNCQSMLNSIYMNNNDPYLIDDKLETNATYDLSNCNDNNNNNIMINSSGDNQSLQSVGNPVKLGHYSLLPNVQKLLRNNIQQPLDMNFVMNSTTSDIMNHNSSRHLHHHHHQQQQQQHQQQHRYHLHGNYVNSANHNIIDHCISSIENYHYVIPNNKVFLKYDTLTYHEKDTYQHNEQCKPMLNAHTLIYMAMNALKKNKVTFHDICEWILNILHSIVMRKIIFYGRSSRHTTLALRDNRGNIITEYNRDIIRQNLTSSRCFQRVPRRKQEPDGSGDLWRINPELQNQLLNNRISSKFLLIWQNQISPKLPDLIELIEQYSSSSSSELNTYQRDDTNDHNVIDDDDEKEDFMINNNTTSTHLHDHSYHSDQHHHRHHHCQLLHNSITNTLKRRHIDSSNNLTDYIKSHSTFNNDMTCQSNSSSSPALSDFYTPPPAELLTETESDLTSSLLLDNEYNFNASFNSISLNENTFHNITNNSSHLLRNNYLYPSMHSSSPSKLIEHEQYCDDLHGLFNEQQNHSIINDQYLFYAPIDIDSTTNITTTISTVTTTNNNNNSSNSNSNSNNNGFIVEELSKASGLNEIPPLDDFVNDELVDPLDLTMNNMNSRLSNDWWSNNNNNNHNHNTNNCLSESMTNFINCTLNELTSREEEEEEEEKDENKDIEEHCDNDICSTDNTCCNILNENCKSMLNTEQSNVKQSKEVDDDNDDDDDDCINTMSTSLIKDEFTLSSNITTFSSTLVPESSIISSSTTTSLLIPTTRSNIINNQTNDSISLNEDYTYFNKLQMTIIKHQQNKSIITDDDTTDVDEGIDVNHSLQSPLHNQQWIDHRVNLDDLDSILGLSYHLN
ncbi:Forkhead box protein [Schistosoma japonicum]|uniref:Forkhead box protein n=1 Tax=Schistosoma japonicum TaxID=6182 RepID=A0A4Z2DS17_SCHJA|nr:Forkhead box protein [Schistosoma japonicum]